MTYTISDTDTYQRVFPNPPGTSYGAPDDVKLTGTIIYGLYWEVTLTPAAGAYTGSTSLAATSRNYTGTRQTASITLGWNDRPNVPQVTPPDMWTGSTDDSPYMFTKYFVLSP